MLINLVLPQDAQQGMHFSIGKTVMLHFLKGPVSNKLQGIEVEKSPAPGGNQTHNLSVTRRGLYHCATTTAQVWLYFVSNIKTAWSWFLSDDFPFRCCCRD